jgi:hypothetical protein
MTRAGNNLHHVRTEFVDKVIEELAGANLITEESSRPHVVNPLTVSISSGKGRLILDLRHVNKQVRFKSNKV